jgi:hypothetical protein
MKVTGQKVVRTEKEVNLDTSLAKAGAAPATRPANAPTLRRPGEEDTDKPDRSAPQKLQ